MGTNSSPYVDPDTGDHIVFGAPASTSGYADFSGIANGGNFGDGIVPGVDRTNDVLLAAGPGYAGLGRNTGDGSRLELSSVPTDIDSLRDQLNRNENQIQDAQDALANQQARARANYAAAQAQATSNLYASGAGDVRDTSPTFSGSGPVNDVAGLEALDSQAAITIEVPHVAFEVARGIGDVATGTIAAVADMTVAPVADVAQAGMRFLQGAVTGDYQPLVPLSSFGNNVVNHGAGTLQGLQATGANVFHLSPPGMVYGAGAAGYQLGSAVIDGNTRAATAAGLGLGLIVSGSRATQTSAGLGGVGNAGLDATAGTTGRYGRFADAQSFADEAFTRYQRYTDEAYTAATNAYENGRLVVPDGMSPNTVIGQRTDAIARIRMSRMLDNEAISEGPGQAVQLNRRLLDPSGSANYRIPDVSIPGANLIMDGTIGFKWQTTPQIADFYKFSGGSNITIVRPTQLGGSYSLLPPY